MEKYAKKESFAIHGGGWKYSLTDGAERWPYQKFP